MASVSNAPLSTAPADNLLLVKRVEYENWHQFPVGTAVTRSRDITTGDHQARQSTVYRLISKDDKSVTVESTVTVTRNGQSQVNEPTLLEYAATFRLPSNMKAEQFSLPSPSAQSTGAEKIEVLGKTYEATVYKWQSSAEAGPVENTLWMSSEVPGRCLKHLSSCAGTSTDETITQLDVPSAHQ